MRKNILTTVVLQIIILTVSGCSFASTKEKINHADIIIADAGVGEFKLDSDIAKYDLSKYKAVSDTSALLSEDETEKTKGKIVYFNNNQYLVLWLSQNKITEIDLKTTGFSTKDGLKVGMPFEELFKKINRVYEFDDSNYYNISFGISNRNILFVISNSCLNQFTDNEINNLYKHHLSIKSSQLVKMKVDCIIIKRFNQKIKNDEMDY
ncbi:MAG TPA: hypothetical protein VK203_08505 [Nostocaceae cyanobacterium]|nr:hypothetical protein [Nostocaceae cyanobacterium]